MDKNGVRLGQPGYDETSLLIPDREWKKFTPAFTQYWKFKVDHFDKICLFKLGKFYEIFHKDAIICQKVLDLNWMGGKKNLHVGFPEKALYKNQSILA